MMTHDKTNTHRVRKKMPLGLYCASNFAKCLPIFKILSAADLAVNFKQNVIKISHDTRHVRHYTALWNINVGKAETT